MLLNSIYGGYLGFHSKQHTLNFNREQYSEGFYYGGNVGIEFISDEYLGLKLTFEPNFCHFHVLEGIREAKQLDLRKRFGCGYYLTKWKTADRTN